MTRSCAAAVVVVVVAAGCPFLPDHELGEAGAPDRLIAFASDFEGYQEWPHVVVGTGPMEGGHNLDAPRTVFVNALPDDDALVWPVGTVIVKEGSGLEVEGGTGTQTHAMVKRGGSYNLDGAVGWEWFEIESDDDGVIILWRGENPPDGESYGCIAGDCAEAFGDCNGCHAGSRGNDFVNSTQLELGRFDSALLP
ncbi:MAG: hypothetical protein Q8O67_29910 [Deltaproteobacteria bacterium]|nr:hypothetical protein [Deltaproteobacteria bacterium]